MENAQRVKRFKINAKYIGNNNIVYKYVGIVKGRKNFVRLPFHNGERMVQQIIIFLTNNEIIDLQLTEKN
jgi:hypothetical protein